MLVAAASLALLSAAPITERRFMHGRKLYVSYMAFFKKNVPVVYPTVCIKLKIKMPSDEEMRLAWVRALNRKDLPKNVLVCSVHFIDGRPTSQNPTPTVNLGYDAPIKIGRRPLSRKTRMEVDPCVFEESHNDIANTTNIEEMQQAGLQQEQKSNTHPVSIDSASQTDMQTLSTNSVATQWIDASLQDHDYSVCQLSAPRNKSTQTNTKCFEEKGVNCNTTRVVMSFNDINSDGKSHLYTGLTLTAFRTLVQVMEKIDLPFKFVMPVPDQMLLTLMKLRLNLLFADIGHRFGISESHASNIFNGWLPILATTLKDLVHWLPRETLRATMPQSFQEKYPKTIVIIDCAETFMQRPTNLKTRGETYSHYKSHNTVKYLVGISPHGQIMFISKGFGGRASDRFIVENSGFFNYLLPGDEVMADWGFTIGDLLFPLRVKLNIPSFTKGKDQLSENDVTETRRIAHVRIHVERAIRRLKVFKILSDVVPVAAVKNLDDILIVCSALVNLGPELIKDSENNAVIDDLEL